MPCGARAWPRDATAASAPPEPRRAWSRAGSAKLGSKGTAQRASCSAALVGAIQSRQRPSGRPAAFAARDAEPLLTEDTKGSEQSRAMPRAAGPNARMIRLAYRLESPETEPAGHWLLGGCHALRGAALQRAVGIPWRSRPPGPRLQGAKAYLRLRAPGATRGANAIPQVARPALSFKLPEPRTAVEPFRARAVPPQPCGRKSGGDRSGQLAGLRPQGCARRGLQAGWGGCHALRRSPKLFCCSQRTRHAYPTNLARPARALVSFADLGALGPGVAGRAKLRQDPEREPVGCPAEPDAAPSSCCSPPTAGQPKCSIPPDCTRGGSCLRPSAQGEPCAPSSLAETSRLGWTQSCPRPQGFGSRLP